MGNPLSIAAVSVNVFYVLEHTLNMCRVSLEIGGLLNTGHSNLQVIREQYRLYSTFPGVIHFLFKTCIIIKGRIQCNGANTMTVFKTRQTLDIFSHFTLQVLTRFVSGCQHFVNNNVLYSSGDVGLRHAQVFP